MEPWGWILVYLVGFTLFQLLLFQYVSKGQAFGELSIESGETTGPKSVDTGRSAREHGTSTDATEAENTVLCPHCGVENDDEQHFTYCRNCLTQLR